MADTYHFYKEGYAVPYDHFGNAVLRKKIDVPAIIASGVAGVSPLAIAGVRTALPVTGFGVGDVLNLFRVPAGFFVHQGGVHVTTAGTAATTIDVGMVEATFTQTAVVVALASIDVDYYLNGAAVNVVGDFPFDGSTGTLWSGEEPFMDVYVTNGTIDVTFLSAAQLALIADFWVVGGKAF